MRVELQAQYPNEDERQKQAAGKRNRLMKQNHADEDGTQRTDARPDGICRAKRQCFGRKRQQEKS